MDYCDPAHPAWLLALTRERRAERSRRLAEIASGTLVVFRAERPSVEFSLSETFWGGKEKASQAAKRYADWIARGRPAYPSAPRKPLGEKRRRAAHRTPAILPGEEYAGPGKRRRRELWVDGCRSCYYCDVELVMTPIGLPNTLTVDHKTPRSRDGPNTIRNTVACCLACNTDKGSLTETEYRLYRAGALTVSPTLRSNGPQFDPEIGRIAA